MFVAPTKFSKHQEKTMINVGDAIPSFSLMSDKAGEVSAQKLLGKRYVLYVYPKDDTYG